MTLLEITAAGAGGGGRAGEALVVEPSWGVVVLTASGTGGRGLAGGAVVGETH